MSKSQLFHGGSGASQIVGKYTEEEKEVVKSLLREHDALRPEKYGGLRFSPENNVAALEAFNAHTGRMLNKSVWRKLCSRLRIKEAEKLKLSSMPPIGIGSPKLADETQNSVEPQITYDSGMNQDEITEDVEMKEEHENENTTEAAKTPDNQLNVMLCEEVESGSGLNKDIITGDIGENEIMKEEHENAPQSPSIDNTTEAAKRDLMGRMPNFTREEKEVAKALLREYNSVLPEKCGGKRMSPENNAAALATWASRTGRQLSRVEWNKLCHKLRMAAAAEAGAMPSRPGNHLKDKAMLCDEEDSCDEMQLSFSDGQNEDALINEDLWSEEGNDVESCSGKSIQESRELSVERQMAGNTKGNPNKIAISDTDTPELSKRYVSNEATKVDSQEFSDTLEELCLQMITIGDWILIQRATFDILVNEEPYHSIQIYANLKQTLYIRRVWGITERSGELKKIEDLRDLCIATFHKSKVCLGYIGPDPCRDIELVEVKYPFTRWISSTCYIRYGKDKESEILGLCSACSGGVSNVKRINIKRERRDKCNPPQICNELEPCEAETGQTMKCEEELISKDKYLNTSRTSNENKDEDCRADEIDAATVDDEAPVSDNGFDEETGTNKETAAGVKEEYFKSMNEAYWQEIKDESKNADHIQEAKGVNKPHYTQKETKIAKCLLRKYNSLKPLIYGGSAMSHENNSTARAAFNACTGRQINKSVWRKLCSRLRKKEAEKRSFSAEPNQVIDDTQEEEEVSTYLLGNHNSLMTEINGENETKKGSESCTNYTLEERKLAKSLLRKYNALKSRHHGGLPMSPGNNAAALAVFNAQTGRQLNKSVWRQLCSRLRKRGVGRVSFSAGPNQLTKYTQQEEEASAYLLGKHNSVKPEINGENESKKGSRNYTNYTQQERKLARSLLLKYNSHKSIHYGGLAMSPENNAAALAVFNAQTGRQLNKSVWRKLCSRLRITKADESETTSLSASKNVVPLKCSKCPMTFSSASNLKNHIRKDHEAQTCDKCGISLSSISVLENHMKLKHASYSEREYKCDFTGCSKAFVSITGLQNHKVYHGEKDFVCDHCGKSFHRKEALLAHMRNSHKILPKLQLKCKHCDEVFDDYHFRRWHTNLIHFPDKYKCSICQKKFGSEHLLKRHSREVHGDKQGKECPECGKKLASNGQLRLHMRLHTGDLFNCSYCPWKGNSRALLYRHIQKRHKEQWEREQEGKEDKFKCTECGKLLLTQSHLTHHVGRVHRKNMTCTF